MKKNLVIILMVALFASCSNKASNNDIEYWSFFMGGDGGYMEEMVTKFNAEDHDFKVNMTSIDWGRFYTKIATSFLSNDLPDIATGHSAMMPVLPTYGKIYPISEIDPSFDWGQFPDTTARSVLLDGKPMAIPLDTHGIVLYYNPNLVSDTSLVDKQGNWIANTWPKLIAGLEEIKNTHPEIQPFSISNPDTLGTWAWYTLYRQAGGTTFTDESGLLNLNIEAATIAFKSLKELIDKGYAKLGSRQSSLLLQDGRVAVSFEGTFIAGLLRTKQPQIRVELMPNFFGNNGAYADNHILFFPKTSEKVTDKQKNALKFAQWLVDNGVIWANAGHIPSKIAVQESKEYKANPNFVFKNLSNQMFTWPKNKHLGKGVDSVLMNYLQLYLDGTITDVNQLIIDANKEISNLQAIQ